MSNDILHYNALDTGYVDLIETFGDELTVVNAARVSFGTSHSELTPGDKKLLNYLFVNKHMSPFRHVMLRFKIRAPEFVMRQMYKHVVGIETTSTYPTQLHSWNEISGRYKPYDEFYIPQSWRAQSDDNKQASAGLVDPELQPTCSSIFEDAMHNIKTGYQMLLDAGVAREQARIILPLNVYTETIWTCSLQAIINFIELRDEKHAQWEIQEYARIFRTIIKERFPIIYSIFCPDVSV
jgi:thymidylate synthase (FAD)